LHEHRCVHAGGTGVPATFKTFRHTLVTRQRVCPGVRGIMASTITLRVEGMMW